MWLAGIFVSSIGFGSLYLVPAKVRNQQMPVLITILLFITVGVLFLVAAVRGVIRGKKFGEATCGLDRIPIPPGGQIRGEIHTRMPDVPRDGDVRVPFSIEIPSTAMPSDETDSSVRIYWTMSVSADVNGVDFQAQFSLPVFNP